MGKLGALGVADLANNIASSVQGLGSALGLINPEPNFHQFPNQGIDSKFNREQWYTNPRQGLYAFSVEPVGRGSVSEFGPFFDNIKSLFNDITGQGAEFGEFQLPITPQEIQQVEDFAVTLKPTQGGIVVNHGGNKFKSLTISGTTGVQPFRGLLGVYQGNGLAIGKPDQLQYRSGYEVFLHFRQWMRAYHETKAQPGKQSLRMLWRNYKDWEFLYVEPLKFTMKRDASDPLLYNYTINFKVTGVHVVEKPLFDLVVSKLKDISVAAVNTYVLIKKNKDVTESITGTISDLESSLNNLKMALKAANKQDLKLSEFSKADAKKLSFKETLQVLQSVGNSLAKSGADPKAAEGNGTAATTDDPIAKAQDLKSKAANPSTTNAQSAAAELTALLDSEPGVMTGVSLQGLPAAIQTAIAEKQVAAALVSRVEVADVQARVQDVSTKLANGIGLGDPTYNQIFGITAPTTTAATFTDEQFEMLYALSLADEQIDGILSTDDLFDTNAALFNHQDSTNGSASVGQGIFSFSDPNAGYKEGFLPSGVTLEDLALSELGDASRWTEIAEINDLKPPYIVETVATLAPAFQIQSQNYKDPSDLKNLQIGFYYLIPTTPTPTGGWLNKGNYLAVYEGGSQTQASSWRFLHPDDQMMVQVVGSGAYLQYSLEANAWAVVLPVNFQTDGVLKPGDRIKIPSTESPPTAVKLQGPRDNRFTNSLSASEAALGVDLRLTEDLDLDLTASGDLNVATGRDNAAQAIVLKLLYEKGSLKKFPSIGCNLTPGKKSPDPAAIRTDLLTSLLQDNRIKDVTKINIQQLGGTTRLSFEVHFYSVQQPVPISIPV